MSELKIKKEKIFCKILKTVSKDIPKSHLIQWIFVILKVLPLFIISHDWNLNYQTGFSRHLLFSIFLYNPAKFLTKTILYVLILIFFTLAIFSISCYTYAYYILKNYGKLSKCLKKLISINTKVFYFSSIFLLGQFYSLAVSNYLCQGENNSSKEIISYSDNCRSFMNYFIIVIQSILIFYFNIVSYVILLISYSPFFTTKNIITNELHSVNYRWLILPILQVFIQIEFFIPFTYMIYIKITIRALTFIVLICLIFRNLKQFYANNWLDYFESFNYILSAVSILVEFCVLFDFNHIVKLQSNFTIICLKLIFEVIISLAILRIIHLKDNNFVDLGIYSSNAQSFFNSCNKFFNNFKNFSDNGGNLKSKMLLIEKFSELFAVHKNSGKCQKYNRDCFCMKYEIKEVSISCRKFIKHISTLNLNQLKKFEKSKYLKSHLKCFYDYIEHNLKYLLENYKGHDDQYYSVNILLLALFYLAFEKNYARSLFYISEFIKTNSFKNSYVIRIHIELLKIEIAEKFKKENKFINEVLILRNEMNCGNNSNINPNSKNKSAKTESNRETYEMYMSFNKVKNSIILDNMIKSSFNSYSNFLNQLIDKQITVESLSNLSEDFLDQCEYYQNIMNNIILNKHSDIESMVTLKLNLCNKFILNNPNITDILEDKLKRIQYLRLVDLINESINCMILNVDVFHEKPILIIEYSTPLISEELNYTTQELSLKDFSELLPSYMADYHVTSIIESIKAGNTKISENQMVFLTKDNYCKIFNFNAYVVVSDQQIKIFVNIGQVKYSSEDKINSFDFKSFTQNKDINVVDDYACFLLADCFGYIIGISRELEKYLYLPNAVVNKLGLNVFKDILKCENTMSKLNKKMTKSLISVYQNIAELNIPQISEMHNTEEYRRFFFEFSKFRPNSNHILNGVHIHVVVEEKLVKFGIIEKNYYLFRFVVETKFINLWKQSEIRCEREKRPNSVIEDIQVKVDTENFLTLSYDKNDIIKRILKVREFSLGLLKMNHKIKVLDALEKDLIWDSKNERRVPTYTPKSIQQNSLNVKRKIKSQTFLLLIFLLIFIILLTVVSIIKDKYSNIGKNYLMSSHYFLISKNIFYSSVNSIVSMQTQVNNLQDNLIDNNFNNSYIYHKGNLEKRIKDFTNYFRFFQKYHGLTNDNNILNIDSIFKEIFPYQIINLKMRSETMNSTLWETLNYWHLINNRLLETDTLIPLFFNQTDKEGSQYYRTGYYYNKMNYVSEYSTVLVIENSMTFMKYSLDKIHVEYGNSIKILTDNSKMLFLTLYGGLSIFILVIFLIQPFAFIKLHKNIFAKYFLNYNNIIFFHTFITEKLKIIRYFIDNSRIENLKSLNIHSLEISISEVEENLLNFDFEQEDEIWPQFMIRPFDVIIKEEIALNNRNTRNSNLNKSNHLIKDNLSNKNSINNINLNRYYNDGLSNSKIESDTNKYEILPLADISSYKRNDNFPKNSSQLKDMRNLLRSELNEIKEEINEYSVDINNIQKECKKKNFNSIIENYEKNLNNNSNADKIIKESVISLNTKYLGSSVISETPKSIISKGSKQAMIDPIITLSSRIVSQKKGKFSKNKIFTKSIKDDKRNTTETSKNSTTIQNLTIGSLLNTKESENTKSNILIDERSFKKQLIVLISFVSILCVLVFLNYFIIQNNLNKMLLSFKFYTIIFERFSLINELFLSYQISLLKNKLIRFDNVIDNKNITIFEEVYEKYQSMTKEIANLENDEEFLTLYNKTAVFEEKMNSEYLCEIFTKQITENTKNNKYQNIFPMSNSFLSIEETEIYDECTRIGRGFNKKGLSTAFENIYNTLLDFYNDFVLDNTKSSEENYSRFNDLNLQTIQFEIDFLFSKIYYLYSMLMYEDESNFSVIHLTYLLYAIIIFKTFILFLIFFFIFSRRMMKLDRLIDKIEEINLNSLIF